MTGRGTRGWSRALIGLGASVAVAGAAWGLLLLGGDLVAPPDPAAAERWLSRPLEALASALIGAVVGGALILAARLVLKIERERDTRRKLVHQAVVFQLRAEASAQECRRLREEIRVLRSDIERGRIEWDERVNSVRRDIEAVVARLRGR